VSFSSLMRAHLDFANARPSIHRRVHIDVGKERRSCAPLEPTPNIPGTREQRSDPGKLVGEVVRLYAGSINGCREGNPSFP
jgi:hypothetical protein